MPAESIGHIQSAGCLGQSESVTAAHNKCIKGLMSDIQEAGKKKSSLRLLTLESEHTISTLWEQDGCDKICSKEELWQASQAFEMAIPMKEGDEEVSATFCTEVRTNNSVWGRRESRCQTERSGASRIGGVRVSE